MPLVKVPPLDPNPRNRRFVDRAVRTALPPLGLALRWWQRLDVEGREHLPATGPVLLLGNHVTWFDPFTVMVAVGRPVHFLAAEAMFQHPILGRLGRWSGAVPRKKFVADGRSVLSLRRWADAGGLVGLFPEAERTWDGRTLPVRPGIGRLIQAFPCPVVTFRIVNGYRQDPRWGAHSRHGRVRVELDPPRTVTKQDDAAVVEAWLQERLAVDPSRGADWPVWGRRLAEGLDNVLYRCPTCDALDALDTRGDRVRCRACGAAWAIDAAHRLHPAGGGEALALEPLLARLQADAARLDGDGVLLDGAPSTLLDVTGDVSTELGRGRLRLTRDTLAFLDGRDTTWSAPLAEIDSLYVVMRRRLQIRVGDRLLEVVSPTGSMVKWQWIGEAWRKAARLTR